MSKLNTMIFAAIVSVYVALASVYAIRVTPFNAPDEPAHFNYVLDVSRGYFPILAEGDWDSALLERLKSARFPPASDISSIRYESHQPPLYYLIVSPAASATAFLGERAQVHAVRLASVIIGACALLALHALAEETFPGIPTLRLLAVGFAALVPMRIAVTASVSNDGLAELLMTTILWQCVALMRRGVTVRQMCVIGVLVGLGLLTKLTLVIAVPVVCLSVLLAHLGTIRSITWSGRVREAGRSWLIAGTCAAFLAVPWWIRGVLTYGWEDPLGLRRHDRVVIGQPLIGNLDADLALRSLTTLFRSFWGQFGWMGVVLDDRIYLIFAMISAVSAIGIGGWLMPWGGFWTQADSIARSALAVLTFSLVGVFLVMVGYNLTYLQPQGRYLFPAMGAIATLSACGIRELLAEQHRNFVCVLVGLAMIVLNVVILFRVVEPALRY